MVRLIPVVLGICVSAAVLSFVFGIGRNSATTQDSEDSGLIRWLNVTIPVPPDSSGLRVLRTLPPAAGHPFLISVMTDDGAEIIRIDAETGAVINQNIEPSKEEAQAILDNIQVVDSSPDVWPYTDSSVPAERLSWAETSYPMPPNQSGIVVLPGSNYCATSDCSPKDLLIHNGRSYVSVDAETRIVDVMEVRDEDREAFERLIAELSSAPPAPTATPPPMEIGAVDVP